MNKEAYYTPDTLEDKALHMLQEARARPGEGAARFDPHKSALLVLDMQRYFLEPSSHAFIPSAPAIVPLVWDLCQAYALRNLPVIFTRHLNSAQNAAMMAFWWEDLIREDDPASRIIPELSSSTGVVLKKSQYDAFYGTSLLDWLTHKEVTQVVICGVMTHLCCETTARSAFVHGFEVFFLVDGTATYHSGFHQASLLNLSHGFAHLLMVRDILARVGELA